MNSFYWDHRKSSQKPTKRIKFVWGGGGWNENRTVGFTVRVLLKVLRVTTRTYVYDHLKRRYARAYCCKRKVVLHAK